MSKQPPPDPVAVLEATALLLRMFSSIPSRPPFSVDPPIWDTLQRRINSSSWLHSAAHGIISITAAGENRVITSLYPRIATKLRFQGVRLLRRSWIEALRLKGLIMLPQLGTFCLLVEIWDVKTAEKLIYAHVVAGFEDGSMVLWGFVKSCLAATNVKFHSETVLSLSIDGSCGGGV
ncbi:hypothetical protein SASPL_150699 [Salvia splendens]|uniref:Uncharacterized protein n=1 Tax=Salvia splendens TaxID=180675 RepID=A0A8X8W7X8_SALSN|nr:hypothetical protein SASPL_150699 [Salvia splendens]